LRQLADGLDSGRVIPEGVDLKSSIGARGGWLSQELRFEFYLTDEGKESTFNQKDSFEWIPDKEAAEALRLAMPRHVRVTPYPEDKSGTVTVEGLDLIRELEKNGFAIVKLT
jgi:hypothetical protein